MTRSLVAREEDAGDLRLVTVSGPNLMESLLLLLLFLAARPATRQEEWKRSVVGDYGLKVELRRQEEVEE